MQTTLSEDFLLDMLCRMTAVDKDFAQRFPGDGGARQPVHTVYGGAHLFRHDTAAKLGHLALRSLDQFAPDPVTFASAIGWNDADSLAGSATGTAALEAAMQKDPESLRRTRPGAWRAWTLYRRVRGKLEREAVEDFRIDFEDGYGHRDDEDEDATAVEAAQQTAKGLAAGTLPPFIGIRIKAMSLLRRALRTTDLYLTALIGATGGQLPQNFVFTLPKIVDPRQVAAYAETLSNLEQGLGLAPGALRIELMVETPQSLVDATGRAALPALVAAAGGRCVGAHFGVYDYTANLEVTAEQQHMGHPSCDLARQLMRLQLSGSGVALSDGATNVMPVVAHRGSDLNSAQQRENHRSVHAGWRRHYDDVRHSLEGSFYQGWDLHPAQLPTRYAALYAFFLDSLDAATARLSGFLEQAAQATLLGDVFDDAATGQGLLNFFLRGLACGALEEKEVLAAGLSLDELRGRSFLKILEGRRQ